MKVTHVLIIRETIWESIASDTYTILTVLALIGIGIWLRSSALQWVGAFMAMLLIMSWASGRKDKIFTIEQARHKLDQIEAELRGE